MSTDQPLPPAAPTPQGEPRATHGHHGQQGLRQAYAMREIAAKRAIALRDLPVQGLKEETAFAGALRDLFAVWDGCRQAIRIYKGIGNPKPVEAKNANTKRKRTAAAPPPSAVPTTSELRTAA